jgi:PAS domain-containing protein
MAEPKGVPVANALDRTIFDAIPIPVFVVDSDVRVLDLNGSATRFWLELRRQRELDSLTVIQHRAGHVLNCIHSADVPEGCGRGPSCKDCVIRNTVNSSLTGETVSRKRAKLRVVQDGRARELQILITACPVPEQDSGRVLLMIEDITHLSTLKNLIPICVRCKNVREDEEYWQTLESYMHEHMGVDFSHGVCPSCANDFYPEYRRKDSAESPKL